MSYWSDQCVGEVMNSMEKHNLSFELMKLLCDSHLISSIAHFPEIYCDWFTEQVKPICTKEEKLQWHKHKADSARGKRASEGREVRSWKERQKRPVSAFSFPKKFPYPDIICGDLAVAIYIDKNFIKKEKGKKKRREQLLKIFLGKIFREDIPCR